MADILFPQLIKQIRQKKKLTQTALAEAIGVSLKTVQSWEYNESSPSKYNICRLIEKLDLSIEQYPELFEFAGMQNKQPSKEALNTEKLPAENAEPLPAEKSESPLKRSNPIIKTVFIGAAIWLVLFIASIIVVWNIFYTADIDDLINYKRDLIIYTVLYELISFLTMEAIAFGIYFICRIIKSAIKKAVKPSAKKQTALSNDDFNFILKTAIITCSIWFVIIVISFVIFINWYTTNLHYMQYKYTDLLPYIISYVLGTLLLAAGIAFGIYYAHKKRTPSTIKK